jgi:chemotaxis protein MotB
MRFRYPLPVLSPPLYGKNPKLKMRRKYRLDEHENSDRWLVSYADFITLLLAVFAVMYAVSQVNEGKYRALARLSINTAGKELARRDPGSDTVIVAPDPQPLPMVSPPSALDLAAQKASRFAEAQLRKQERMQRIARDIMTAFAPLVEKGQVRVTQSERGVRVEIDASVLFALGEAALQEDSSRALRAVGEILKNGDYAIHVEGHTDDIPITTARFPSNWELSAVRASSVVRLLIDNGVQATRLTALGYGENRPVESNDSEEGRARNRRVTLMILSTVPDVFPETSPETPEIPRDTSPDVLLDPPNEFSA